MHAVVLQYYQIQVPKLVGGGGGHRPWRIMLKFLPNFLSFILLFYSYFPFILLEYASQETFFFRTLKRLLFDTLTCIAT